MVDASDPALGRVKEDHEFLSVEQDSQNKQISTLALLSLPKNVWPAGFYEIFVREARD